MRAPRPKVARVSFTVKRMSTCTSFCFWHRCARVSGPRCRDGVLQHLRRRQERRRGLARTREHARGRQDGGRGPAAAVLCQPMARRGGAVRPLDLPADVDGAIQRHRPRQRHVRGGVCQPEGSHRLLLHRQRRHEQVHCYRYVL